MRSIAAQTDCSSIRNSTNQNRLHIDDHDDGQYDSSGSFDSTSSRNMNRRRRKPATKSVASGGFEYLENIVCYDRTCLRNRFKLFSRSKMSSKYWNRPKNFLKNFLFKIRQFYPEMTMRMKKNTFSHLFIQPSFENVKSPEINFS